MYTFAMWPTTVVPPRAINKRMDCLGLIFLFKVFLFPKIWKIYLSWFVGKCQYLVSQASSKQISSFYKNWKLMRNVESLLITQTFSPQVSQNSDFCKQNCKDLSLEQKF